MASVLSLDVGTKRIGVAIADTSVTIATPFTTVEVDGTELETIKKIISDQSVEKVVVGYPRNQAGDATEQTAISEAFGDKLQDIVEVVYQDESVTSVAAEDLLIASGKPYSKGDIDSLAASIILQDYLEIHRAA